ncbi:hypothetical protein KHX94_03295 [Shewanella dokdonensis]|uniref:Transketolase N-terminal domain-containing protein n=1 Tax=Shewanella dokdonensis TaxID=712036 RepID=A0ABX8DGA3_9GAMM|nr:hypothetical protein KHX94_03295 [Shewanella dokdonensis]
MVINTQSIASKIRKDIIWSIYHARSGHPGGSLSCVDIVTVLFHQQMSGPSLSESVEKDDVFIMSKGHAAPTLYAAAASKNILSHESLKTLRKINSPLQGHPDVAQTPWVHVSTGSLGQGVSVATGIAKGFKLKRVNNKYMRCLEMVNCRKDKFGKPQCLPHSISSITSPLLLITTNSKVMRAIVRYVDLNLYLIGGLRLGATY